MATYDVTAYPILAIRFRGIEAESPEEALRLAMERWEEWALSDEYRGLASLPPGAVQADSVPGMACWIVDLVDEDGQPPHGHSQVFDCLGRPIPREVGNGQV